MSAITTHVLDVSRGSPAGGVPVTLEIRSNDGWKMLGGGRTDPDGRAHELSGDEIEAGIYRLTFDTASYFAACGVDAFYPIVQVVFEIADVSHHHHVPLLLSPFGYSTYRGS
jgi:5-hydroxyisourate hydrolase